MFPIATGSQSHWHLLLTGLASQGINRSATVRSWVLRFISDGSVWQRMGRAAAATSRFRQHRIDRLESPVAPCLHERQTRRVALWQLLRRGRTRLWCVSSLVKPVFRVVSGKLYGLKQGLFVQVCRHAKRLLAPSFLSLLRMCPACTLVGCLFLELSEGLSSLRAMTMTVRAAL